MTTLKFKNIKNLTLCYSIFNQNNFIILRCVCCFDIAVEHEVILPLCATWFGYIYWQSCKYQHVIYNV